MSLTKLMRTIAASLLVLGVAGFGAGGRFGWPLAAGQERPAAPGARGTGVPSATAPGRTAAAEKPVEFALDTPVTRAVRSADGTRLATLSYRFPNPGQKNRVDEKEAGRAGPYRGEQGVFATVKVWDLKTGRETFTTGELKDPRIENVAFSSDGKLLAISLERPFVEGDKTDKVELWDLATGQLRRRIELDWGRCLGGLAFSPDGTTLAVSGGKVHAKKGGGVRLVDVRTGKVNQAFWVDDQLIHQVAFSADGKLLAGAGSTAAGAPRKIWLWDWRSGKEAKVLACGSEVIRALTFAPDGKRLVTGSGDGRVQLWDTRTGEAVDLPSPSEWTDRIVVSPDGRYLAASGSTRKEGKRVGEVRLWALESHELKDSVDGAGPVVGFTRDGKRLALLQGRQRMVFRDVGE